MVNRFFIKLFGISNIEIVGYTVKKNYCQSVFGCELHASVLLVKRYETYYTTVYCYILYYMVKITITIMYLNI